MSVFHIAFVLTILVNLLTKGRFSERGRKQFCCFSGTVYFLLAALRGFHVGFDTYNYYYFFKQVSRLGFSDALLFNDRNERFFYGFMWLVGRFTDNYTVLLTLIALLFVFSVWLYIYRYSEDPCLSVLFLIAFNLYQFSLTGLRQTMAISFTIFALMALKEKKTFWAIVSIIIAAQFHTTAYIFLLVPVLKNIKLTFNKLYIFVVLLIFTFFLRVQIAGIAIPYINERGYELSLSSSGYTMAFVIFVLYIISVIFCKELYAVEREVNLEYWMMIIAVFFEMLVTTQNIFFRFAFYFLMGGLVLIPEIISCIGNYKSRNIVHYLLYLLLSVQYLIFTIGSSGVMPYKFFWQI